MSQFNQDTLRAWAGAILLVLSLAYLVLRAQNGNIEYILIGLAAFLVGGAFFNRPPAP